MKRQQLIRMARTLRSMNQKTSWEPDKLCHARQRHVLHDPARFKCVVLGRRWGKSTLCAIDALDTCQRTSGARVLFMGTSLKNARLTVWDTMQTLVREFFPTAKVNATMLSIKFENGSTLFLGGCSNAGEIDKVRGQLFDLIILDEGKDYGPYLRTLIMEVLRPTLADTGGRLTLIGTPGPLKNGFFYECSQGKHGFKSFGPWNISDNHWLLAKRSKAEGRIVLSDEILDEELKSTGRTREDASFRREWLGEWIDDKDAMVYSYDSSKYCLPSSKDLDDMHYVIGIDTGHVDADAIAVLGFNPKRTDKVWLIEEMIKARQGFTELMQQVKDFYDKYDPISVVIDSAAGGNKFAFDVQQRHDIPITPAQKHDKNDFIRLLNDDLRTGKLNVPPSSTCAQELPKVTWVGEDMKKRKPTGGEHSDIIDALRYAWRECLHWTHNAKEAQELEAEDNLWHDDEERKWAERIQEAQNSSWIERKRKGF